MNNKDLASQLRAQTDDVNQEYIKAAQCLNDLVHQQTQRLESYKDESGLTQSL